MSFCTVICYLMQSPKEADQMPNYSANMTCQTLGGCITYCNLENAIHFIFRGGDG